MSLVSQEHQNLMLSHVPSTSGSETDLQGNPGPVPYQVLHPVAQCPSLMKADDVYLEPFSGCKQQELSAV